MRLFNFEKFLLYVVTYIYPHSIDNQSFKG